MWEKVEGCKISFLNHFSRWDFSRLWKYRHIHFTIELWAMKSVLMMKPKTAKFLQIPTSKFIYCVSKFYYWILMDGTYSKERSTFAISKYIKNETEQNEKIFFIVNSSFRELVKDLPDTNRVFRSLSDFARRVRLSKNKKKF